jgi:CHAD domain-containing protein
LIGQRVYHAGMSTKPSDGALIYLDQQIDALRTHTPAALDAFDPTGIHQARVGTRRLKAGLDLLQPLLAKDDLTALAKAGKRLRRRLGPLRDLDVMIDHLGKYPASPRLKPAVEWIVGQFEQMRREARQTDREKGKKSHKLLEQFADWWKVRHKLGESQEVIATLLSQALHDRFDRFSSEADVVAGIVTDTPPGQPPVDIHQLRIDGKALRYTFEIADAHGIRVPKSVFKSFKAMQESLGEWHDYVVLADETVSRFAEVELALHDPDAASLVLDLGKQLLRDSIKSLGQFKSRWKRSGASIRKALETRVPLTRDIVESITTITPTIEPVIPLETGLDRPEQVATPPAAAAPSDAPEVDPA